MCPLDASLSNDKLQPPAQVPGVPSRKVHCVYLELRILAAMVLGLCTCLEQLLVGDGIEVSFRDHRKNNLLQLANQD